jgi:hypothetical protein
MKRADCEHPNTSGRFNDTMKKILSESGPEIDRLGASLPYRRSL